MFMITSPNITATITTSDENEHTSATSIPLTGLLASRLDLDERKNFSFPSTFHEVTVAPNQLWIRTRLWLKMGWGLNVCSLAV